MRFDLSDDQDVLRKSTRRFIETECPIATVRAWHALDSGFDQSWWRRACDLGWSSMLATSAAGGGSVSGRALADGAILAEERGRALAPGPFVAVNVVAAALAAATDESRHDRELRALVSGESIATWAFAEPGSRWNPEAFSTTVDVRAGTVVVNGAKSYVEAAGEADVLLVTARDGDGLTNVLVPANAPGVHIERGASIDLNRRFGEVRFVGVTLPADAIVGAAGAAGPQVARMAHIALVLQCADTVGTLDRVFEFTLRYLNDRFAFGRPIGSFQSLKHRAADMALWLESSKAVTDAAASAVDDDAPEAARLVSAAKSYVGSKSLAIIQDCMQMHGGISMTWEHDLHLHLRRATLDRALYGTPEQHRERLCVLLDV